jgi:hypothetical protein
MSEGASNPRGFRVNNTFVTGSIGDVGFPYVTNLTTYIVDTFNASLTFGATGAPFWTTTMFSKSAPPIAEFYLSYTPGGPPAVLRNETPVFV